MSRFAYYVALFLALAALVSGAPLTRKGPTIPNAGGVALSADGTIAFVSTTSTTNAAIYAYPVPITASSNLAPTPYFTTTASVQYYYIAASVSTSPQLIWILDNQNAQLLSLPYVNGTTPTNTTMVYNFGIANLDLVDGMYYQASTNLLFFAFYDHFNGAANDYIGYINPSSTTPTLTTLFTTNLVASLAGIAVSSSYLYYGSVTTASGSNAASIARVPISGGATPSVAAGTTATILYTTTNPVLSTAVSGNMIYPSALVLTRDESILYITDIGNQGVQPASTPHVIYGLYPLYATSFPINSSVVYTYTGANTEIQQSFALTPDQSTLYFAATGAQNGLYQTTAANSTILPLPPPRPAAPTSTPAVSSSAAAATSAPASATSARAASSSVVAPTSAPIAATSAPAAATSAPASATSARAASSSAVVPPTSAPVSATSARVATSAPAGGATSAGGGGGGSTLIPAGTIVPSSGFTFSDAGDALSCLTSNTGLTVAFAGSNGGDIFTWSFTTPPASVSPSFVAGTGSSGASFIACQSNPSGSLVYLLDTRGVLLYSWAPATPTVAPVVVATFSGEVTGALTALAIDFVANVAYVGTRSTDVIYLVNILTPGTDYGAFFANPANSDLTAFFLSADRTTLYYGFPAPAQGVAGGIASIAVSAGTIADSQASTTLASSVNVIYPDSIWVNGTNLYFKDGGAYHGQAGPTQASTQTISTFSLTATTPVITNLLSTTTLNLPPGLIAAPPASFQALAFTTPSLVEYIFVVNATGAAPTSAPASSAAAATSAPASATSAPVSATSARAASSSAAAVPTSAPITATSAPAAATSAPAAATSARVVTSAAAATSAPAGATSARAASSSAVVAPTSAGTTGAPRVVGDPMFVGFLRQRFQVHGMDGVVYNILSQASVSINALFVFLEAGSCPIVDGVPLTNCWSHPGSYFGSLALQTAAGDQLEIVSGPAASGFGAIRFDGETVKASKGVEGAGAKLSFKVLSTHEIAVTIDNYRLVVENSDMFVNLVSIEVLDWQQLASVDQPHGLLGQTWKPSRKARGGQVVAVKDVAEGDVDDYVITSDTLFGTDFVYNKFAKEQ